MNSSLRRRTSCRRSLPEIGPSPRSGMTCNCLSEVVSFVAPTHIQRRQVSSTTGDKIVNQISPDAAARDPPHPYLQVQSLSKVYATDDGPVRALDRVSITQRKGEFVSLAGP